MRRKNRAGANRRGIVHTKSSLLPSQHPISLSDEQLSVITRLAEPLAPHDRSAFLAALAQLLRHEPRPLGDGAVFRSARELLASGVYKRLDTMATWRRAA
jgi:hypothetical protein